MAETRISRIQYLPKIKKFCDNVFACLLGAQVELFHQIKRSRQLCDTVPLIDTKCPQYFEKGFTAKLHKFGLHNKKIFSP